MKIENLFHYPELAVGLKPSASQGEARLRGLYRIIYSKTISRGWQAGSPPARACGSASRSPVARPVGLPRLSAYPKNPAARTAITPQAKRFQWFG